MLYYGYHFATMGQALLSRCSGRKVFRHFLERLFDIHVAKRKGCTGVLTISLYNRC